MLYDKLLLNSTRKGKLDLLLVFHLVQTHMYPTEYTVLVATRFKVYCFQLVLLVHPLWEGGEIFWPIYGVDAYLVSWGI